MTKSMKAIPMIGIFCLLFLFLLYFFLMQSTVQDSNVSSLAFQMQEIFNLDKVVVFKSYTAQGVYYRVLCYSTKTPTEKQMQALGTYVWDHCTGPHTPHKVTVVFTQNTGGCVKKENVWEMDVPRPSRKTEKVLRKNP